MLQLLTPKCLDSKLSELEARKYAKFFGLKGVHSAGGGFLPARTHKTFENHFKKKFGLEPPYDSIINIPRPDCKNSILTLEGAKCIGKAMGLGNVRTFKHGNGYLPGKNIDVYRDKFLVKLPETTLAQSSNGYAEKAALVDKGLKNEKRVLKHAHKAYVIEKRARKRTPADLPECVCPDETLDEDHDNVEALTDLTIDDDVSMDVETQSDQA